MASGCLRIPQDTSGYLKFPSLHRLRRKFGLLSGPCGKLCRGFLVRCTPQPLISERLTCRTPDGCPEIMVLGMVVGSAGDTPHVALGDFAAIEREFIPMISSRQHHLPTTWFYAPIVVCQVYHLL